MKKIKINHGQTFGTSVDYPSLLGNNPIVEIEIRNRVEKSNGFNESFVEFKSPITNKWHDRYKLGMLIGGQIENQFK